MKKLTIPAILVATVMVAGMFAFLPVEQATTVHTSGQVVSNKMGDTTTGLQVDSDGVITDIDGDVVHIGKGLKVDTGTLDMNNGKILNVGAAGTSFTSGGGLTLSDTLTVTAALTVNPTGTEAVNIVANGNGDINAVTIGNTDATDTLTINAETTVNDKFTVSPAGTEAVDIAANSNGAVNDINIGGTGADTITIGGDATNVLDIVSTGLNVATSGDISDAGGAVTIADDLTVSTTTASTYNFDVGNDAVSDTFNLFTGSDGTADDINIGGGSGADTITIGGASNVLDIVSTGLNVATTGEISDAGGPVDINDAFILGAGGATIQQVLTGTLTGEGTFGTKSVTVTGAAPGDAAFCAVEDSDDADRFVRVGRITTDTVSVDLTGTDTSANTSIHCIVFDITA